MKRFKDITESVDGGMSFNDAVKHAKKHGNQVTYGMHTRKWHSIDKTHRDHGTHFALHPDEAKRHGLAKSFLLTTMKRNLEEGKDQFKVGDVVVPDKGPHVGVPHEVVHLHGNGQINIRPKGIPASGVKYRLGAAVAHPNELQPHFPLSERKQSGINREVVQEAFKEAKKKKSTPKESKGNGEKIEVKGPGPEDKFQKDPVVTPLTTAYTKG